MEEERCVICGEPAAHCFGTLPVCENVACQQAVLDMVNGELQLAAYERWDDVEVVDVSCV